MTLYCLIRQWNIELKQLPEQQQVGVVTLSTADLQHQLSLAVATALEALMAHLVQAASHRCQAVLAECHHLTKYAWPHVLLECTSCAQM